MTSKLYDVLIIGGGPAGLSIATALARQVYSALVLDSGAYRNAIATHMHAVPGWDHANPADFRAKIRADLQKRYESVEFKSATIAEVRKLDSGVFEAVDEQGTVYRGKKLGLGTGVRDIVEKEGEGYADCWGLGIFHCMFCHGYEERGVESAGMLASGFFASERAGHASLMAKRLSKNLTIYTNDKAELAEAIRPTLHSSKITYDNRKIAKFALHDGGPAVTITFADGTTKTEGFILSHPNVEQRAPFLEKLGVELDPAGKIAVTPPFNETSVPGCFAAGDASVMMMSVTTAVQSGGVAGVGVISQLQHELDAADEI